MRRFDKIALIGMSCEGNGPPGTLIDERRRICMRCGCPAFYTGRGKGTKDFAASIGRPCGAVGEFHTAAGP